MKDKPCELMGKVVTAKEIQEGDWVIIGGAPYVFYEFRLMSTAELVKHFLKIIEDWRQEYIKTRETLRSLDGIKNTLKLCHVDRQDLTKTVEETQKSLSKHQTAMTFFRKLGSVLGPTTVDEKLFGPVTEGGMKKLLGAWRREIDETLEELDAP